MFNKKFKKYLSLGVILLVVFVRTAGPLVVLAQEADPTPTPIETQEQTADPTPTPTQDPTPTPTPDSTQVEATNSAELNNNIDSGANTGENTATQSGGLTPASGSDPEATDGTSQDYNSDNPSTNSGPSAEVSTGDAASVTVGENKVNTNSVNSNIIHTTINLFVNENGDIDLSDPFTIANNIVSKDQVSDGVVNVVAVNSDNYAYLSNDIVSVSNAGGNAIEGSLEATINTGNAISIISLLNQVNFTIVGSTLHVVTINIFGNLSGNIILPEFSALEGCSGCGMSVAIENDAVVENNIGSGANTGNNSMAYSEEGSVDTGNAASVVNLTNFLNTNMIGLLLWNLIINVYGSWQGDFLGWGDVIPAASGGSGLALNYISPNSNDGCANCMGDVSVYNKARVSNNISSLANTGQNTAIGGKVLVKTGNAYSIVTLANFVNTNFIDSVGFFGFINIFGIWNGDIGGASAFKVEEEKEPEGYKKEQTETADIRESGGVLSVNNSNNVGEYVLPGDTVTFFIDVKNMGTGKVYETKLDLFLMHNGENVGGTTFDLGVIGPGKKTKVTTGFVLSENAPPGTYVARARASGSTGENRQALSSVGDSAFRVGGTVLTANTQNSSENDNDSSVLGAKTPRVISESTRNNVLTLLLLYFVLAYLGIRAIKKQAYLRELFSRSITLKERIYSFRIFLF